MNGLPGVGERSLKAAAEVVAFEENSKIVDFSEDLKYNVDKVKLEVKS